MADPIETNSVRLPADQPSQKFSWTRVFKIVGAIVVIGGVVGAVYALAQTRSVKIAWASLVLDRREHFLDCEQLPFNVQVEKAFNQHPGAVDQVKAINGVVDFRPEAIPCKNYEGGLEFIKGDALLIYKNRAARSAAEKVLGNNFFGILYRGISQ